ncbi:MAG: Hpt domain-containing protein, partial [Anaerolineae bacterium]|nr:Hpt domain-containing protein [Anaerolineae bacterium]
MIETTVESTDDLLALFDPVAVTPEPPAAPAPAADLAAPLEMLDFSLDLAAVEGGDSSGASTPSLAVTTETIAPSPAVTPDGGPLTDDFVFDVGTLGDSSAVADQITAATANQAPAPFAPEPASADAGWAAASLQSAPASPSDHATAASDSSPAIPDLESLFDASVDVSANGASTSSAYQPTLLLSPEQAEALQAELGIAPGAGSTTAVAADNTPTSNVAPEAGVVTASDQAFSGNVDIAGSAALPAIDAQGTGESVLAPSMPVEVVGVDASITATSEAEAFTEMSAVAEDIKVIGPLQVPVQLYTIFLSEADELVRQLNMRLDEWRLMPGANVPDEAISAAHTLGGTAGIIGLTGLSGLGYEMEAALLACRGNGHIPNDFQLGVLLAGADEMRRLLHHFAAGFYREANADVRSAVHELAVQWHADYGPRMTSAAIPASAWAQASDAAEAVAPSLPDVAAPLADAASLTALPPTEPETLTVTSVPIDSPTTDASWPPAPPAQPQPPFTSGFMPESVEGEPTARAIPESSTIGTMTTAFAVSELTLPPIDIDAERKTGVSGASELLETQAPALLPALPDAASEPLAQATFDVDGGVGGPDSAGPMGAEPNSANAASAEIPSLESTPTAAAQDLSEPMEVSAPDPKTLPSSVGSSNELASGTIPALAVATLAPLAAAVSTLAPPPAPVVTAERAHVTVHDTTADSDLDEVDVDLFPIFEEEAQELIPQLAQALRDWQAQPGQAQFPKQALRTLHTLKGSARLAGAMRLGDMAHQLETAVEQVIREDSPGAGIADLIERADEIANRFEQLRRGEVHSAHEYEFHAASAAAPTTATSTQLWAQAGVSVALDTPIAVSYT